MRKTDGNESTVKKVELETDFPATDIQPTVIGATENNDKIEGVENILQVLFELSGVSETVEQFLERKNLKKATLENGEVIYIDTNNRLSYEPVRVFLEDYYEGRWAYLRTPNGNDIYGQVSVNGVGEMKTEKGIITMPMVSVAGHNVFFPISALLSSDERNLYEMYKVYGTATSEKDSIEKQIMDLVIRLSTLSDGTDIVDSNNFLKDITEFCERVGTVQKLSLQSNKLNIQFAWRKAIDTDGQGQDFIVLPPCTIVIDMPNHSVKGLRPYHPHIINGQNLCMGGVLTNIVNECMASKSLKGLVEAMVQFGNSYTSNDCGLANDDRAPSGCVFRFLRDVDDLAVDCDFDNLPVKLSDIVKTLMTYYNRPRERLSAFRNYLKDYLREQSDDAKEIVNYIVEHFGKGRALEMFSSIATGNFASGLAEKYDLNSNEND